MFLSFFIVFYPVFRAAVVVASLLVVLCSRWFFSFVLVLLLYPRLDDYSSLVTQFVGHMICVRLTCSVSLGRLSAGSVL